MQLPATALLLVLLGCASPAVRPAPALAVEEPEEPKAPDPVEEPPPAKKEDSPPPPKEEPPPPKVEEPPAPAKAEEPAPAPKKEDPPPPPPKTAPEVQAFLMKAAKRQGTDGLVGGLAPTRFIAKFATVLVHSPSGSKGEFRDDVECFALPVPGAKEARMRSEVVADGKRIVLGHNGRFGWMHTVNQSTGKEEVRRFTDIKGADARDAEDLRDIDHRRRMLRMALRGFFLGAMAESPLVVTRLPDDERSLPEGTEGNARSVKVHVLERAADPAAGEPAMRLLFERDTLELVAVILLPPKEGEPSFLLTLAFDEEKIRAKKVFPKGVRVPDWVEMFEIPADPKEKPSIRIQAGFQVFEIDAAKVLDSWFSPPQGR